MVAPRPARPTPWPLPRRAARSGQRHGIGTRRLRLSFGHGRSRGSMARQASRPGGAPVGSGVRRGPPMVGDGEARPRCGPIRPGVSRCRRSSCPPPRNVRPRRPRSGSAAGSGFLTTRPAMARSCLAGGAETSRPARPAPPSPGEAGIGHAAAMAGGCRGSAHQGKKPSAAIRSRTLLPRPSLVPRRRRTAGGGQARSD